MNTPHFQIFPINMDCDSMDSSPIGPDSRGGVRCIFSKISYIYINKMWAMKKIALKGNDFIDIKLSLTTEDEITKAVKHFNASVLVFHSSTLQKQFFITKCSGKYIWINCCQKKSPKKWQQNRYPLDKKYLNFLSQKLKKLQTEFENRKVQGQLERLDTTNSTDYSLWKVTRNILKPICS